MNKTVKLSVIIIVVALLYMTVVLTACQGSTATQTGTISDITKGYFAGVEGASSVTINLDDYVNANGTSVTYSAQSDNVDIATVSVDGATLTVSLQGAEGNTFITVFVYSNGKKSFSLSFGLTAKVYERVACIGDSLTYGHSWHNQSYPVYLQEILGDAVEVKNFGVNGSAVTNRNETNYRLKYDTLKEYADSLTFQPDIVVVMLGSNDGYNWTGSAPTFEQEYTKLLNSYLESGVEQIVMLTSPPTLKNNAFNIPDEVLSGQICPRQRAIAIQFGLPLVDVRAAFEALDSFDSLYRTGDGVHFSVEGAQFVAQLVADKLIKL
ncbi:MAG: hypothetical protein J1G02_01990 [Clostridiales bacterium]|nr:hypothetical protein [Clostridiales bacterium]